MQGGLQELPGKDDFAAAINSSFRAHLSDGSSIDLTLSNLDEVASNDLQETFALHFVAPSTAPRTQGTYRLEHGELGKMELFLVPIGLNENGLLYEAVFNHFHPPGK